MRARLSNVLGAAQLSLAALLKQQTTITTLFAAIRLVMKGANFVLDDEPFSFSVQSKSLVGGRNES